MIHVNPLTVRNILTTRAIFSTMAEKLSYEFNENLIVQEFTQTNYHNNFDIITYSILIACTLNLLYIPSKEKIQKLEKIEYFSNIRNITSKFFFIFMLIFTKNIESAT